MAHERDRLRRAARRAAATFPDVPAGGMVTPCQPATPPAAGPLAFPPPDQTRWIAVRVEDHEGHPVRGEAVEITLDGGRILRGTTDDQGRIRHEGVEEDRGIAVIPDRAVDPGTGGGAARR